MRFIIRNYYRYLNQWNRRYSNKHQSSFHFHRHFSQCTRCEGGSHTHTCHTQHHPSGQSVKYRHYYSFLRKLRCFFCSLTRSEVGAAINHVPLGTYCSGPARQGFVMCITPDCNNYLSYRAVENSDADRNDFVCVSPRQEDRSRRDSVVLAALCGKNVSLHG